MGPRAWGRGEEGPTLRAGVRFVGRIPRSESRLEPMNRLRLPSPFLPPPNLSHRFAGNGWGEGRGEG